MICPELTNSSGKGFPPKSTCVSPSTVGSGREEALACAVARFEPKMEINPPGATGRCVVGAAALTTPAWFTTGAVAFAETIPVVIVDPDNAGVKELALIVTDTPPPPML